MEESSQGNLNEIVKSVYKKGRRLVAPIMGFPGVKLAKTSIKLAQQNYREHYKALKEIAEKFKPDILFPLMDLSIEANALGRYTIFPINETTTVPKKEFDVSEIETMKKIDITFDTRLIGYVEVLKLMRMGFSKDIKKGAFVTGPYTLASLIMGAEEAAVATVTKIEDMKKLCNFTTKTIQKYMEMLISSGAQIIMILEPTAVMLGPEQFRNFSSGYVKKLVRICKFSDVDTIYHTCGNTMHLLEEMEKSGVSAISLDSEDAGVDLKKAAEKVSENVIIMGNINPATTMLFGKPHEVKKEVKSLLDEMKGFPNFILSTGCDLPLETPAENIETFIKTGREYKSN